MWIYFAPHFSDACWPETVVTRRHLGTCCSYFTQMMKIDHSGPSTDPGVLHILVLSSSPFLICRMGLTSPGKLDNYFYPEFIFRRPLAPDNFGIRRGENRVGGSVYCLSEKLLTPECMCVGVWCVGIKSCLQSASLFLPLAKYPITSGLLDFGTFCQ